MIKRLKTLTLIFGTFLSAPLFAQNLQCGNDIKFFMPGFFNKSEQTVNVSDSVSVDIKRYLSKRNVDGYIIAANVSCQTLTGQKYTGSGEEWLKFFESTLSGLSKNQYKDIAFTLVGENEAVIQNNQRSKEYILVGNRGGDKQILKNLALLSSDMKSIMTITISGNEAISEKIDNLYKNLTNYVKENSFGDDS